jgi:osmotically-inducible protein OsmY
VILLSLALIVSACATVDPLEDNRIEAEVKAGLVAEKSANLTRIGVISTNGVVYLTGTVAEPNIARRRRTSRAACVEFVGW